MTDQLGYLTIRATNQDDCELVKDWARISPEESLFIMLSGGNGENELVAVADEYQTVTVRPGQFADPVEAQLRLEIMLAAIERVYDLARPKVKPITGPTVMNHVGDIVVGRDTATYGLTDPDA